MNDSLNDRLSETEPVTIERSKTSVRIVSDYIKSQVIQKELRTGDKIPTEVELSRLLNVGRGSVREAVKLLEALHVLEIRRGDGTYIANPTDESLFDSLLFKIILENISLSELLDFRLQIEIAVQNLAISNAKQEDIDLLEANYGEFARRIYLSSPSEYPKIQELDVCIPRPDRRVHEEQFNEEYLSAFHEHFFTNYSAELPGRPNTGGQYLNVKGAPRTDRFHPGS